jgi:hypothetical protein
MFITHKGWYMVTIQVDTVFPTNDGSKCSNTEIALTGSNPWYIGDGLSYTGASSDIDIDTNNGLIIRDYKGTINGVEK